MDNQSRKFLYLVILILIVFLIGCSSSPGPTPPITTEIPTEIIIPTSSNTPVVASPTPKSTATEPAQEQPLSISDLDSSPLLNPENVSQLTLLGEQPLDPEGEVWFSLFDWSDDGSRIVVCAFSGSENSYRVYDLFENTKLAEIPVTEEYCEYTFDDERWLQFSRDGDLFSGLLELVHPKGYRYNAPVIYRSLGGETESVLGELIANHMYLPEVTFSSQGTRLAITDIFASSSDYDPNYASVYIIRSEEIELFDVETGEHWGTFIRYSDKTVIDLEYSTVGQYLVVGTSKTAEAWDVKGGLTYSVECPYSSIKFSPVAEVAAISCDSFEEDAHQFLWDLESGDVLPIA